MKRAVDIFVKATLITVGLASPSLARQGQTVLSEQGDKTILIWERQQSQCAAEAQQRHQDIANSLKGHPMHEIAAAVADSDAKNPSVAECAKKKSGGGGGGDDTTSIVQNNSSGDPQLDGVEKDANASATKPPPTTPAANAPEPPKKPNPNIKKLEIGGAAAAAGVTAIALAAHGGGGSDTPSGTGTSTGGGTSTKWDPTGANGVDMGPMMLQANGCAGSDAEYTEKMTVMLNSSGAGTVTLDDTPNFERVYQVSGITEYNVTVMSSGTFSFLGAPVPATISISFSSNTQATLKEMTNWGSCSNVYQGTVSR